MIGTIRKHSKVVWAVIITVVVVTFVFWGAQTSPGGGGRNTGEANFGAIGGDPIKRNDFMTAYKEVNLYYRLMAGDWPKESAKQMGFDVEQQTYYRLLMLKKIKEEGIQVSDETVARKAAEMLAGGGRGEGISADAFEKNILAQGGLTLSDFGDYVRDMLAIEQLKAIHGMAGDMITPEEVRGLYQRENQQLATEAVFFLGSNHLSEVVITPDALGAFFTNQMSRYRIPERVQIEYVEFGITNFTAAAEAELMKTNFNERIDALVQRMGTNYFKEAKTPEENRAKVREEVIRERATLMARSRANDFARAVDQPDVKSTATFEQQAAKDHLTVQTTAPFDQEDGPKEFVANAVLIRDAFNRTPDEPFSPPLEAQDAVYVIALKARVPSEIPSFDSIRDRVQADYKQFQAANTARRQGAAFALMATNGLAAGKTFAAICLESHVQSIAMPPIFLTQRSAPEIEQHISLQQYLRTAFTSAPGQVSSFVPTAEGGFVVYVREKLPLDVASMNAQLPEFTTRVRQTRQNEAFNEWLNREADRNLKGIASLNRPAGGSRAPGR